MPETNVALATKHATYDVRLMAMIHMGGVINLRPANPAAKVLREEHCLKILPGHPVLTLPVVLTEARSAVSLQPV